MKLSGGKYEFKTVPAEVGGGEVLVCLRYGEPWRDFVGDNAILALYRRAEELEQALRQELGDEFFEERMG